MVSKSYIENQYRSAVLDFELASDEDARFDALCSLARLEYLASVCYGFDYSDGLSELRKLNSECL